MKNIVVILIPIILAASVFLMIRISRSSNTAVSPIPLNITSTPNPVSSNSLKLLTYVDSSGFTFVYEDNVKVEVVSKPNDQIYSSLELSIPKNPQSIAIKVENSNFDTVDEWFKGNKKSSIFGEITKTKLADLDAREFTSNNLHYVIALDQGALFTLSTNSKKSEVLYQTFSTIHSSFKFTQPTNIQQDSTSSDGGVSDIIDEGEEIVE